MKTTIIAAAALLALSVGVAFAQGVPAGYQGATSYGSHGFSNAHQANGDRAGGDATRGG